MTEVNT